MGQRKYDAFIAYFLKKFNTATLLDQDYVAMAPGSNRVACKWFLALISSQENGAEDETSKTIHVHHSPNPMLLKIKGGGSVFKWLGTLKMGTPKHKSGKISSSLAQPCGLPQM